MAEETLVQQSGGAVMKRPSHLPAGDVTGTEGITHDDIQMPRLGLAQALSPQIEDGNMKQIDGLKVGQLFNGLTGEVYGKGPIEFMIVRRDKPRWIEFNPRDQGGGIRDFDVPAGDPRTEFGVDPVTKKSIPPLATKFYDFIIMMLPIRDGDPTAGIIALSLKSTGLKVARQLNGLIKKRNAPIYAGKYKLTAGTEKNSKGTYAVFQVSNSDIKNDLSAVTGDGDTLPGWVNADLFKIGAEIHASLQDKKITIEREDTHGDDGGDDSFDTAKM